MQEFVFGFLSGAVITAGVAIALYKLLSKAQRSEFEKLAQSSLDINSLNTNEAVEEALRPFRERLMDYQKAIEAYNLKGSENTAMLKNEMEHVVRATQKIEMEAATLSRALKGDVKAQGNWGEMILERILEASGFQEGREYVTQGRDMNYRDSEGNVFRPDVVVRFPDGANIVVDSKVSLVAYERFVACEEEAQREQCLKELKTSARKHIDELSAKKYHALEGINSPDYVMMFVPIEA